jgi:hypothetical protein
MQTFTAVNFHVEAWIMETCNYILTVHIFAGKGFSRGGARGKMASMVPTARSLRVEISLITCSSRTKSAASTTSLPLHSTRQPEGTVASGFLADRGSRFHLTLLPVILPYWPVTGSKSITLYAHMLMYLAPCLTLITHATVTKTISFCRT